MSTPSVLSILKKRVVTRVYKPPKLKSFILEEDVVKAAVEQQGTGLSTEAITPVIDITVATKQVHESQAAQDLTSPIRMCQYTRVRLPSAFLIPLTLVPHPKLQESWVLPDFSKTGRGQRRYVLNSRKVLELMGRGAWKRLNFRGTQPVVFEQDLSDMARRRVWRSDMIEYVEKDMAKFAPWMTLGP